MATSYGYDNSYQLTQASQGTTTTESYAYDAVGNRTSSLGVASYTTNSSNEITANSNASYTYDSNGNETTKVDSTGTTTYTWDFENRLTSVTLPASGGTVSFKYDPFDRRIYKSSSSGTSVFAYDGDNLIEEANTSGAAQARYLQGLNIDEPLAMLRSASTSYYNADGIGSITSVASSAGALTNTYTYDSFGKLSASTGSLTNPFRYTAREFDSETNLQFSRSRYYEPGAGRFLTEDPMQFKAGYNFYSYVLNDPLNFFDPWGLATLNYWGTAFTGPWISRWGHVSLTLDDGTYISFYPTNFNLLNADSPNDPVFSGSLSDDNLNEGGAPDVQVKLDNLDEAAIKTWWNDFKKTQPKFRGLHNNCSTVISQALDAGGGVKHAPKAPHPIVSSPGVVLGYAQQLQKAGNGVYVPPTPPSEPPDKIVH